MKVVLAALHEIGHLFVDDGSLALFAAVLIALVAGAIKILDMSPLWGGLALVVGLAGILIESLQRFARAGKKR